MFRPKRILVATDFSAASRAALEHAGQLAERFGSTIDVLHAWEEPHSLGPDDGFPIHGPVYQTLEQFARERAGQAMDQFLNSLEPRGAFRVRGRIEMGDPAETILRVAAEDAYDLVVMGTHGWTGLKRLLLGSVARKVVGKATCPVLTIREAKPSRASTATTGATTGVGA
jgi:nucleotide-binding universal stress UspA family protein